MMVADKMYYRLIGTGGKGSDRRLKGVCVSVGHKHVLSILLLFVGSELFDPLDSQAQP